MFRRKTISRRHYEERNTFQNAMVIEKVWGKSLRLQTLLIVLNLYSFFISMAIFDLRNKSNTEVSKSSVKFQSFTSLDMLLILQSLFNLTLIILEIIHLKIEITLMNEKNTGPEKKKSGS